MNTIQLEQQNFVAKWLAQTFKLSQQQQQTTQQQPVNQSSPVNNSSNFGSNNSSFGGGGGGANGSPPSSPFRNSPNTSGPVGAIGIGSTAANTSTNNVVTTRQSGSGNDTQNNTALDLRATNSNFNNQTLNLNYTPNDQTPRNNAENPIINFKQEPSTVAANSFKNDSTPFKNEQNPGFHLKTEPNPVDNTSTQEIVPMSITESLRTVAANTTNMFKMETDFW